MEIKLADALGLKKSPVAVIWTDREPPAGLKFKEGRFGCVASMLLSAAGGRTAFFDRKTFGCPGGGTGLGFGDQYTEMHFPVACLLSTGNQEFAARMNRRSAMSEGERFFRSSESAGKFVASLPMTDIAAKYVVFKPLEEVTEEAVELVVFLASADQLSALVVMASYADGCNDRIIAPFGASCQSILFGYAEAARPEPRAVIGFFDISQRKKVDPGTLSLTVPFDMFQEMEANVEGSFLRTDVWRKLLERQ